MGSSDDVAHKSIPLSQIEDLYLEPFPSPSFRMYLQGTSEVVQWTTQPNSPEAASTWFDALYAAVQLQSCTQEEIDAAREGFNNTRSNSMMGSDCRLGHQMPKTPVRVRTLLGTWRLTH